MKDGDGDTIKTRKLAPKKDLVEKRKKVDDSVKQSKPNTGKKPKKTDDAAKVGVLQHADPCCCLQTQEDAEDAIDKKKSFPPSNLKLLQWEAGTQGNSTEANYMSFRSKWSYKIDEALLALHTPSCKM